MGLLSKEQIRQMIKENNIQTAEDIQSSLKELFADTLQEMLEAEPEMSLDYDKQDGAIVNKAAYMVIGIDLDGHKDVLGIWIGENESSKFWLYVLNELRNRGVQDILITCVDNLTGFTEAISACYPKTEIQKCIIHQIRNSTKYVSYKDIKKITAGLKPIYKAVTEEASLLELEQFEQVWAGKYPLMVRSRRNNWNEIATFFKYSPEIRKIIYTTNID